jgi:hypothetical protein
MNQVLKNVCDDTPYPVTMCPNFGATQQQEMFPWSQTHQGESGSVREEKISAYSARFGAGIR